MKKILLLVGLVVSMMLSANDIIVLNDATKIDAKILEVSDTEVRYKKANNLNGPTFVQKTNTINVVIYENGETQMFNQPVQQTVVYQQQPEQQSNQPEQAQTTNSKKLQFNPQPSDNYIVGLTVGYAGRQMKIDGDKYPLWMGEKNKMTSGFMFGLTVNPTFKYGIGLRTGLFLNYSRESEKDHGETYYFNDVTLSMPLQISYRYEIIKKLSVMLYTGPVFDFGAFANTNIWEYEYDIAKNDNLYTPEVWERFSGNKKYIGFNCSWGIGAGIQWDRLRLDIGGEFGMVNKCKDMYDHTETTLKWNKPIYVMLTCFF